MNPNKEEIKLTELCANSDHHHQEILDLIETDKSLDKIWELQNAFERKCSTCCLSLMRKIDFKDIRMLYFCRKHQWKNVPTSVFVADDQKILYWKVQILYQAIYSQLLDVVKYIVEIASEGLAASESMEYGTNSILEFTFKETTNVELQNFFMEEKIFRKCVRPYSLAQGRYSDLAVAFIYENKFSSNVVEKFVYHLMNYGSSESRQQELENILDISIRTKKLKHLDLVLKDNQHLLTDVWSNGKTFSHELAETMDVEHIKLVTLKYKPDLTIKSKDGDTILHKIIQNPRFYERFTLKEVTCVLLELEPKLANIPREVNWEMPLQTAFCYNFMDLCYILVEKYKADINHLDSNGQPILYYATRTGNLDMMILLLKNNAKTDLVHMSELTKPNQQNLGSDIQYKIMDVVNGRLDIEIFNSIISMLVEVHGLRMQNLPQNYFYLPDNELIEKESLPKKSSQFNQICILLYKHSIFDFNLILKILIRALIEENYGELTSKTVGLEILMSLLTTELHYDRFDKQSPLYCQENGFQSVKEFISIKNYNSICQGREMPMLKHLVRCGIRQQIFKNLTPKNKICPMELFETLDIPNCLKKYLAFLDNIPLES